MDVDRRRRRWALPALAATGGSALAVLALVAGAPTAAEPARGGVEAGAGSTGTAALERAAFSTPSVENWAVPSTTFHSTTAPTVLRLVSARGATDGRALKLQLNAYPDPGAAGGAVISSDALYQYGTFGTRMRTANCAGQDHPGVVTGTFTYSLDHGDSNGNGVPDNDEIDIEFLCAQPDVVYLTIWTDYSETSNNLREITRIVNLRTGAVLSNCYIVSYGSGCQPAQPGEDEPAAVAPVRGFNSATGFHSYSFRWQPDRVTFFSRDSRNRRIVLWDYRGPRSRIPQLPQALMQSVTYTQRWDPLNGAAHNQPTLPTAAYIDSTTTPN